jgi:hypothetical protein
MKYAAQPCKILTQGKARVKSIDGYKGLQVQKPGPEFGPGSICSN